jgi:hypothetical protein
MTENGRLQRLWNFTIKICDYEDTSVGTGIVVSTDGKIFTCAHVAEAALGMHPREAMGEGMAAETLSQRTDDPF